jgi:hypothetical protein
MTDDSRTIAVRNLIADNYDATNVTTQGTYVDPAGGVDVQTGQWSREQPKPVIAIHGRDEGVESGGATGHTAYTGSGGVMQVRSGTLQIDCVAGTRADCEGLGNDGSDLNPKGVREALEDHLAEDILLSNGLTPPDPLRTISPTGSTEVELTSDATDLQPLYAVQLTAQYTYFRG